MGMKTNNVSSQSFKSHIRFIDSRDYEYVLRQAGAGFSKEMWQLNDVDKFENSQATERILYCIAGVMRNLTEKSDYLFHWYPKRLFENDGYGSKNDNLTKIEAKLKELSKSNKLEGLLVGGMSKDYSREKSKMSLKVLNVLKNAIRPENKDNFTVFFAQNIKNNESNWPETAFLYSNVNDTYYIRCRHSASNYRYDIWGEDNIRKHFDFIHIADKDKVFLDLDSQDVVPNEFWNKNKFAKGK